MIATKTIAISRGKDDKLAAVKRCGMTPQKLFGFGFPARKGHTPQRGEPKTKELFCFLACQLF